MVEERDHNERDLPRETGHGVLGEEFEYEEAAELVAARRRACDQRLRHTERGGAEPSRVHVQLKESVVDDSFHVCLNNVFLTADPVLLERIQLEERNGVAERTALVENDRHHILECLHRLLAQRHVADDIGLLQQTVADNRCCKWHHACGHEIKHHLVEAADAHTLAPIQ